MSTTRNNNFDLLKVLCTFCIIVLHYLNGNFGGALTFVKDWSFNYWIAHFMECLSINAVNLFVFVTSFFLVNKEKINTKKCIKMIFDLLFYCTIIYALLCIIGIEKINLKSLISYFDSIFTYWYIYTYIILYLLSPYLNRMLKSLSKKQHFCLIVILLFFFSFWPSFINNITIKDNGYGITNFVVIYVITAYIKQYGFCDFGKKNIYIYLGITAITCLISCISSRAYNYNFILNIFSSIFIFNFFKSINVKCNIFYKLQPHSLAVYIIHLNPLLIQIIFKKILNCQNFYQSSFFVLHMIISCIAINVCCVLINIIKIKLFDPIVNKILTKIKIFNFEIEV